MGQLGPTIVSGLYLGSIVAKVAKWANLEGEGEIDLYARDTTYGHVLYHFGILGSNRDQG